MSNELANGRYILDSTGSIIAAGTKLRLSSILFVGTGDNAECILHDGSGKEIWRGKLGTVATAGYQTGHNFGKDAHSVDGLNLNTIDNGVLFVYLAKL